MFEVFRKFRVCEPNILSDHCVLEFSLCSTCNINNYTAQREETEPRERLNKKFAWDDAKKNQYIFNLNGEENDFFDLTSNLMQAREPGDIDENIDNFFNLMEKVCDPLFAKNLNVSTGGSTYSNHTHKQQRPWFDEECQALRDRFYRELNTYRECKNNISERNMINARSNLKNLIRKKRYIYDKSKTEKLISTKYEHAKAYWRLLKQAANKNMKHSISSKQFADYFKAINDPGDRFFQIDEDILFFNEQYVRGEFQIMFDELNGEILRTELLTAIKQLRTLTCC